MMAEKNTTFEFLFERFYKRIEKDEDFFDLFNVDKHEVIQLAHDRAKNYLIEALEKLSSINGLTDVDFDDYDDEIEELGFKTTSIENKLIVDLMFQIFMERDETLLHAFEINFTPSDLNVFSPANERTSYRNFMSELRHNNEVAIDDYKYRDRKTGKLKNMISYSLYSDI